MASPWRSLVPELAPLALRQHGLFTRAQVRHLGVSDRAIDRRLASGEWTVVDHGVYRYSATPTTWHQRILAACLAGPAMASHRTAVTLLGVPGFSGADIEVTARRHRRRKAPDVVWHESHHMDPIDMVEIAGIPTTTAARTFADLATVLDDVGLLRVGDELVRRRLTTVPEMAMTLERLGRRRPGAARARRVLEHREPATGTVPESALETEFEALLARFGLPAPVRQHEVRDGARFVARLDFALPEIFLDSEVDGTEWHGDPSARARDRRRDEELARLGWLVRRYTAWDIRFRAEWVATEAHADIRARTAAFGHRPGTLGRTLGH
jgi:hypothetical protein